jgi:hypothetical protein
MALGTGQRSRGAQGPRWRATTTVAVGVEQGEALAGAAALCSACHRPALAARVGGQPSAALCLWPSASTHGFFSTKGNTVFLLHH